MNFHETKMGAVFFNHQLPELIETLREIADTMKKPAAAPVQLMDTGEPDFYITFSMGTMNRIFMDALQSPQNWTSM